MVATASNDTEVFQGNAVPVPGLRRHVLDLDDFTADEISRNVGQRCRHARSTGARCQERYPPSAVA